MRKYRIVAVNKKIITGPAAGGACGVVYVPLRASVWARSLRRLPFRRLIASQRMILWPWGRPAGLRIPHRHIPSLCGSAPPSELPPRDLETKVLAHIWEWWEEVIRRGVTPLARDIFICIADKTLEMYPGATKSAFIATQYYARDKCGNKLLFEKWLERWYSAFTSRLTQVFIWHGYFGRFLFKIE